MVFSLPSRPLDGRNRVDGNQRRGANKDGRALVDTKHIAVIEYGAKQQRVVSRVLVLYDTPTGYVGWGFDNMKHIHGIIVSSCRWDGV